METQKTLNSQNNLEKEEWSERNDCPDFTRSCKTTVMKTVLAQKHARLSARRDGEHGSKHALTVSSSVIGEAGISSGENTVFH